MGASQYAVDNTCQLLSTDGQPVNCQQGHGCLRLTDSHGNQWLSPLDQQKCECYIDEKVPAL